MTVLLVPDSSWRSESESSSSSSSSLKSATESSSSSSSSEFGKTCLECLTFCFVGDELLLMFFKFVDGIVCDLKC